MSTHPQPRPKRIDAQRNREKILDAARQAFAENDARSVSMAEIARRAGVGMATLYRNYPGRRDLLEAIFVDEVDEICAQAAVAQSGTAGDAFYHWLHLFFQFAHSRNEVATELIRETGLETAVFQEDRRRICAAGQPLLQAAQDTRECGETLDISQILDALVYIGRIRKDIEHVQPIADTFFRGLKPSNSQHS